MPFSRPSSSNGNRMSSGQAAMSPSVSSSSKLSFFGGFKKKNRDDFDKDDGELIDYPGSLNGDTGANISMNQLGSLRDRDRYPSLTSESPSMSGQNNAGRTMSLRSMTNFDTTPIIPTFTNTSSSSKSQSKQYRQTLTNTHRQILRGEGYPSPAPPNANFQQPYPPSDRPMPNGPIDSARARSVSSLGYQYQQQQQHPNEYNGRAMSMGGSSYMRGPPPMNGNGRPMARKSFPNQYGSNGPLPSNGPNPISSGGRPPMNNQPPPMNSYPAQGPGYGVNPSYVMHARSINSKSTSPNSSSNTMSRPNSGQTLSSSTGDTPVLKPVSDYTIVESEVNDSLNPINRNQLSTVTRNSSPRSSTVNTNVSGPANTNTFSSVNTNISGPVNTNVFSPVNTNVSSDQKVEKKSHLSVEPAGSTDSSSSSYGDELLENSSNVTSVCSGSKSTAAAISKQEGATNDDLAKRNFALLDEVRLVTSELADSIRCELKIPESAEIEPRTTDTSIDNLTMNRQERVLLLVSLQNKLDVERRQRLVAEEILQTVYNNKTYLPVYDALELERRAALSDQKLQNALQENSDMAKELKQLRKRLSKLETGSDESDESSSGEELSEVGAVINTGAKQFAVNRKPTLSIEKLRAIESQRDALRDALQSLRERKDYELKQFTERISQLEEKLEKEKSEYVVTHGAGSYRPLSNSSDNTTSPLDPPSTPLLTEFSKGDYLPVSAEWSPVGFNPYPNLRKSDAMGLNLSLSPDRDEQLPLSLNSQIKSFN